MDVNPFQRIVLILCALFLVACDSSEEVFQTSDACSEQSVEGEYLVQWKDGSITKVYHDSVDELMEETIEPNKDLIKSVNHNLILFSDPIITPPVDDDKQKINPSFHNWGKRSINSSFAWSGGHKGDGITVAVIDSGVAVENPLLQSRISYNEGELGLDENGERKDRNGVDDDDNGYVDDYAGYNFETRSRDNFDNNGHGTHVAGIIASDHDLDDYTIDFPQGVAPDAKILPLDFIDSPAGGTLEAAVEALDYVILMNEEMNIRVVNASWGGPACSSILEDKIIELQNHNVLFVAAAGNNSINLDRTSRPEFPAAYTLDNLITVGSTTPWDGMATHSNYGQSTVDIFAPGEDIYSTVFENGVGIMTGTSMAAPFVSGAAAVLWGAVPDATYFEIKQAIMEGVYSDSDLVSVARGRLDLQQSLNYLLATRGLF